MAAKNLGGIKLAAALSEQVYRRNVHDWGIDQSADLVLGDRQLINDRLLPTTDDPNLGRFTGSSGRSIEADGTRYFYTERGFVAMVVQKDGKFWVTFRGTDSAEDFKVGAGKAAGGPVNALDGTRKTDLGDWVTNIALGAGTAANSQADDALALTRAVIEKLALGDKSKVVVAGQSLGGGLAAIVSAVEGVQGYAIAPAPFRNQISVEAQKAAVLSI